METGKFTVPFFCCTNLWGLSYLNRWDPCYVGTRWKFLQVKEAAQFTDDVMQAMAEKLGINVMATWQWISQDVGEDC